MDIPLYINTTQKSNTSVHGSNSDFIVEISGDGMLLPNTSQNYLALGSINLNYTWNNIDASKYNNNSMRYSSNNGSTFKTITFSNGNYSYSDISNYISNYLETQNDSKTGIQLYYVSSLKKIFIELETNYQVDFRSNTKFAELIGFQNSTNIITTSSYENDTPNITNSVDNVIIHSSLLSDTFYNGNMNSDVLYTFSTNNHRIGYDIPIKEENLQFYKMNNYLIKRFRIRIKDSLDRFLDLEDSVAMLLFIRSY